MPDIEQKTKDKKFKPAEAITPEQKDFFSAEGQVIEKEPAISLSPVEIEAEKKERVEKPIEKEEVVKEMPEQAGQPIVPPTSSADAKAQVKNLQTLDKDNQVKALCKLAFEKGVDFAIEVARELDNAYVLDEFHDNLVDQLRQRLFEEGKLKKLK